MQFALSRALLICAFFASLYIAAAKQVQQVQPQQQQQQQGTKLKRDAALSFGNGIYHGPSHKYLPPAVTAGYESTYAALHGNGLASSSGFDFASLDTDNSHHYHHYNHQQQQLPHQSAYAAPHQGHGQGHGHGHGRPVYISSGGAHYHHRQQAPKVETYIVQTSNNNAGHAGHHQSHGNGLGTVYKYAGHGQGGSSSGSGAYLSLLGSGHKQHGGGSSSSSSSTYLLATPSFSTSHGLGHGLALGHGHVQRPSLSHHYAPALSHGVEHEEHSGYSYETPSIHFKQPLSSYGVPLLPAYEHSPHELVEEEHQHQQHQQQQQEPAAQLNQIHKSHGDQQTPSYALGHKGLGHFSYTSSKPHALNTDIHQSEEHNELVADLSKAPFKPSAFLGATHEPSNGFDFATPTSQYLQPPTAAAYDYHAPSVLYGAPGQSGDSATPIFEPDSTYLPPVASYGAPATPTHSYH